MANILLIKNFFKLINFFVVGPKTFTGEDSAELYLHGSRAVVNAVFLTLSKVPGLESAKAGEFTKRLKKLQKFYI